MKIIQTTLKVLTKKNGKLLAKAFPVFGKVIRGTFERWYQTCARKSCKCHRDKKYQHGPYYRISYFKDKKTYHIYIPANKRHQAKIYCQNYQRIWDMIEKISQINISLLKLGNKSKKEG